MNKKILNILDKLSTCGLFLTVGYMFVLAKWMLSQKVRYFEIYMWTVPFVILIWGPYFAYTTILLNEIRLKRRIIRKRHIYISSFATLILITTMVFLPYERLKDLYNIKNNNYIYIEDTVKDIQSEKKRGTKARGTSYDYVDWTVETESNGVIIYEEVTRAEHEILKQIKAGDRVEMAFLPITKIPAEISKIEEE